MVVAAWTLTSAPAEVSRERASVTSPALPTLALAK